MAENARNLWIVNHHAALPSKDGRYGRHLALAKHLGPHGWSTTLFVSSTTHPSGEQRMPAPGSSWRGKEGGVHTVWIRVPAYGRSAIRRIVGMVAFAVGVLRPSATASLPRPDVVIGSTVHPLAAWAGMRLARRHRVPFVYEIRDVWPETLIDLGSLSSRSPIPRAMQWFSKRLCAQACLVLSPLPGVRTYLDDIGHADVPFMWVSNGIEEFQDDSPSVEPQEDEFSFMYLGSVGNANGLRTLIDAFDRAWAQDEQVGRSRLRIVGDGPMRDDLVSYGARLPSADSVSFEERIPRKQVPERAAQASCFVVNLADLPVYRYGVSLNKLFDYLVAGKPVIIATNAMNNPVAEANGGLSVPADDTEAIAAAMVRMRAMPAHERQALGDNGRQHVLSEYTYEALADKLHRGLESLLGGHHGE